jgi:hypothetical protein
VIAGGGLVGASNFLLERMRGRRELRGRFLAERREAYAAFLGTTDRILRVYTSSLEARERGKQIQARLDDLIAEVDAFVADPQLVVALSGWSVDATAPPVEGFRAAFELVRPHLSESQRDHFGALLEEVSPLQGEFDALLARIDDLGVEIAGARATLDQAHTLVELCAGSDVRAAAHLLRETIAITTTTTDRGVAIRSIAQAREAFVAATRRDLGAQR